MSLARLMIYSIDRYTTLSNIANPMPVCRTGCEHAVIRTENTMNVVVQNWVICQWHQLNIEWRMLLINNTTLKKD